MMTRLQQMSTKSNMVDQLFVYICEQSYSVYLLIGNLQKDKITNLPDNIIQYDTSGAITFDKETAYQSLSLREYPTSPIITQQLI